MAHVIEGRMHFLERDPKYLHEKPYTLRYIPDAEDGFPQTNIERVEHTLHFHDIRDCSNLEYKDCGFLVTRIANDKMAYSDYGDTEKIETLHTDQVLEVVRKTLGAASAELIDYTVRRRHETWPIATGDSYDYQQPASRAHIDHTYDGGVAIIREAHGEKADLILERKWQLVNVWHPLRGPLVDWPLALCDARTVDFARDTMAGDVVDRNQVFENTQVHHSDEQKWYFLSGQMPDELILFKNADSEEPLGATPGVPHASFDNPERMIEDFRRESIEMRVLVVWN